MIPMPDFSECFSALWPISWFGAISDSCGGRPLAQAGATLEAAASSVPKEATAETSESASQGIKAEEPTAQSMTGSIEDALDQLDEPVAAGSTSAEGASDVEQSGKGEAVSEHNNP
jgi:hypothetical protein